MIKRKRAERIEKKKEEKSGLIERIEAGIHALDDEYPHLIGVCLAAFLLTLLWKPLSEAFKMTKDLDGLTGITLGMVIALWFIMLVPSK